MCAARASLTSPQGSECERRCQPFLPPPCPQGTFSLIIEALHTDSPDDLATGKQAQKPPSSGVCLPSTAEYSSAVSPVPNARVLALPVAPGASGEVSGPLPLQRAWAPSPGL